jgi:arylamine N-acetyltransferase
MKRLQDIRLFPILQQIPYENISKIMRLNLPPEQRPRNSKTVLKEHQKMHFGGTCFSLVNLLIRTLEIEGFKAYPVKADVHRRSFPHFFAIAEDAGKSYLIDPGYLINRPLEIIPDGKNVLQSGAIDFSVIAGDEGGYTLMTRTNGQQTLRYTFNIEPVSRADFMRYWIRSFDYINAIVASRFADEKFIYINGNYVQIRSKGNVEKYDQREKALEYLEQYFHFDETLIKTAESLLEKYRRSGKEADK